MILRRSVVNIQIIMNTVPDETKACKLENRVSINILRSKRKKKLGNYFQNLAVFQNLLLSEVKTQQTR